MKRRSWLVALMVFAMVVMSACGGGTSDSTGNGSAGSGGDGAAGGDGASQQEELRFSIATSGTAGVWYPVATAIAETMSRHVPYVRATAEPSSASVENVRNMREGRIDMAILASSTAYEAGNGLGEFASAPMPELRSLFHPFKVMSGQYLVVRDDSGIQTIEDLRGKKVGVGAPGSSNETTARDILNYHGITYDDIDEQLLSAVEMVTALKDGVIDAAFLQQVPGAPVMSDLISSVNVRFISWDTEEFLQEYPFYVEVFTPAGAFQGIDYDIETVGISGVFYTTADRFTEDQVYEMVKAVWDNTDEWQSVHAQVNGVQVEDALVGMVLPLHAGAYKYFQEKGLEIPDELVPPEVR